MLKILLYAVPLLSIIAFIAATIFNWQNYAEYVTSGGSAPFSAFVVANVILYIIPGLAVTLVLTVIRRIFRS